jgi:hypothetical protein
MLKKMFFNIGIQIIILKVPIKINIFESKETHLVFFLFIIFNICKNDANVEKYKLIQIIIIQFPYFIFS